METFQQFTKPAELKNKYITIEGMPFRVNNSGIIDWASPKGWSSLEQLRIKGWLLASKGHGMYVAPSYRPSLRRSYDVVTSDYANHMAEAERRDAKFKDMTFLDFNNPVISTSGCFCAANSANCGVCWTK